MKIVTLLSQLIIPIFILFILIYGYVRKVRIYDAFILGAKQGPIVILKIFPYLLAIFMAVKSFQASGAFDILKELLRKPLELFGIPAEVLTMALIKPLSGSASTVVFTNIIQNTGPDSFASLSSAVIAGSAETTFYVIALYLGTVGIKKTKFLVPVCIIADIVGIIIAITVVKISLF